MNLAPSTDLVLPPRMRRFLTAVQEMRGHDTIILSAVYNELNIKLPHIARRQFLDENRGAVEQTHAKILEVVGHAARVWNDAEMLRNDRAWTVVDHSDAHKTEYHDIAELIPHCIFLDVRFNRQNTTDHLIVAQAVYHRVPVLATANMMAVGGIDAINDSLREKGLDDRTMVYTPDGAVEVAFRNDGREPGQAALDVLIALSLPEDPADIAVEPVRDRVLKRLDELHTAGFPCTAAKAKTALDRLPSKQFMKQSRKLHERIPNRALNASLRYRDGITGAARRMGHEWS